MLIRINRANVTIATEVYATVRMNKTDDSKCSIVWEAQNTDEANCTIVAIVYMTVSINKETDVCNCSNNVIVCITVMTAPRTDEENCKIARISQIIVRINRPNFTMAAKVYGPVGINKTDD